MKKQRLQAPQQPDDWELDGGGKFTGTGGTGRVRCPLFLGHATREIHCSGPDPDMRHIARFSTKERKIKHLNDYCRKRHECCEWYLMITKLYGDDSDG